MPAVLPAGAIKVDSEGLAFIDSAECVECGVCADSGVCPVSAVEETDDPQANLKKQFGRLVSSMPGSKKVGRSGEFDVKTNDVTQTIPPNIAGLRQEINRPGGGARLGDVEALRVFLEKAGWKPEIGRPVPNRPGTGIDAGNAGTENPDRRVRDQAPAGRNRPPCWSRPGIISPVPRLWASVNIACRGEVYPLILKTLAELGLTPDPMAKFNLGLGRKLS